MSNYREKGNMNKARSGIMVSKPLPKPDVGALVDAYAEARLAPMRRILGNLTGIAEVIPGPPVPGQGTWAVLPWRTDDEVPS